jgi:hypothetical protein
MTGKQMKKKYRFIVLVIVVFLLITIFPGMAMTQDFNEAGYFGSGVAKIKNGNVSDARKKAFIDAQEKVLIAAVGSQLSLGGISKYFLMLKKLFFEKPDIYLQSFKLISEHTLYDIYQVNIQGFVQQDMLRLELKSLGILDSEREKTKVLIMIAEQDIASASETSWWESGQQNVSSQASIINKNLSNYFRDSGFDVIDPSVEKARQTSSVRPGPDADPEEVARFADAFGADIVVIGRSELKNIENRRLASVESIQCAINARVISVISSYVLVQAATYKLGMHVDELTASRLAINNACSHLAGQMVDKIYLKLRNSNYYEFRLAMDKDSEQNDVKKWLDSLKTLLPDVVPRSIEEKEDVWIVKTDSSLKRADIVQMILHSGVEGYQSKLLSADGEVIEMKISSK